MNPSEEIPRREEPKPLLHKAAEVFLAITLTIMVIAVFSNVVLRYAFDTGFVLYEELSRLLFVWLVCVGTALAAYEDKHLNFTLVVDRVSPRTRTILYYLAHLIGAIVLGMVIKGSWDQVLAGMQSFSPVMGYPLALAAAATLFMACIMELLLFKDVFIDRLLARKGS
jgi:TRAP-type C4-dicarboxylate transport system permease small subunit